MKTPSKFTIYDLRFTIWKKSSARGLAANRKSAIVNRKSTAGIALVITLILLSVTLIMAVAFLAVARRERNAVTTTTDTATARLATDAALAWAQAQIAANILASTNLEAYGGRLLVSTNYVNSFGFDGNSYPGSPYGSSSPTNVNYDYLINGSTVFSPNQRNQNIANLYLLPRAPVFVQSNQPPYGYDFRYWLDLNRNGLFEANGNVPNVDSSGVTNGTLPQIGDPEWVGVLERPDQPHSPNNHFVARYAFLAQPIGNSLDLNYIHNQTLNPNPNLGVPDGYFRNEGVGSWELNLAAFLADLNTNQWNPPTVVNAVNNPYIYQQPFFANSGAAFEDARTLLWWRYAGNYNLLAVAPPNVQAMANAGQVDGYTVGNLMTNTVLPFAVAPAANQSWAGSDNPNRFFALPNDLFDASKVGNNFLTHLATAGNSVSTYDRYTFYRMLDQLGTDSTADDYRMNLNYCNMTNGAVVPGMETNGNSWAALDFFTNAANVLLQHYTGDWSAHNYNYFTNTFGAATTAAFGVGNIPVYINGRFVYSPAVNRLLQLAANMYDASTNVSALPGNNGHDYPHVFRPTFWVVLTNGFRNVYINGYTEITSVDPLTLTTDLANPAFAPYKLPEDINSLAVNAVNHANIYGVPWIIGAKKGLPSFNQFSTRNAVQVTRKLQVTRTDATKPGALSTNQMFIMSVTNQMGFAFWNSYFSNYNGTLTVYLKDQLAMTLTNGANGGTTWYTNYNLGLTGINPAGFTTSFTTWPGSAWDTSLSPEFSSPAPGSFLAVSYDVPLLPEVWYKLSTAQFFPSSQRAWEPNLPGPPVFPQFGLMTTNRLQAFILDNGHVLDYIQLAGPNGSQDFNDSTTGLVDKDSNPGGNFLLWSTNAAGFNNPNNTPTWGVVNQIRGSRNQGASGFTWKPPSDMPQALNTVALEGSYFDAFFTGAKVRGYSNTNTVEQVPYTPTRTFWNYTLWQANDPLVHYLASDLNSNTRDTGTGRSDNLVNNAPPSASVTAVGDRYQPWGRNQQMAFLGENVADTNQYNLRFRDPLVWGSDYWNFPAGKYPTAGWLGRVHRGTPWQTVYLKQRNVLDEYVPFAGPPATTIYIGTNTWAQWTGDTQLTSTNVGLAQIYFDAANSAPIRDRDLFDLFTATPNVNATHGTLSVNQTHLAAWSALFSGLVVLTNATDFPTVSTVPLVLFTNIPPAGLDAGNSAVGLIVNGTEGINATRAAFTNSDGVVGAFAHVGDILNVPAFTEQSPFLNRSDDNHTAFDISDEVYEWLPQQTLGLLRASSTPRYVIYCYGQTLRPAPNSLVTDSGQFFGLCTNYQITAESAARAVVRVDRHVAVNNAGVPTGTNYSTVVESFNVLPSN